MKLSRTKFQFFSFVFNVPSKQISSALKPFLLLIVTLLLWSSIAIVFASCKSIAGVYQEVQTMAAAADCPNNNTPQCAIPIKIGEIDTDAFTRQKVYYSFQVDAPGEIVFTINPIPNTRNVNLEVQDANYNRVYTSSFTKGHPGSADVKIRTPGKYYAVLTPGACCGGANNNYGFLISQKDQTPELETVATDCPNPNTPQCAIPLLIGEEDSDTFDRTEVYYRFPVDSSKSLTFTLDPMPGNRPVELMVQDSEYNQLYNHKFEKGNPGSTTFDFRDSGGYFLIMKPGACCSGASNDYTVAISE